MATPAKGEKRAGSGRKLALDVLATAILQLVSKARSIILLPILVRVGNDALYGIWTMLSGIVSLFVPLLNLSVHQGLLRYSAALSTADARRLFVRVSIMSAATSVTLSALGAFLAWRFRISTPQITTPLVILTTAIQVPLVASVRVNSSFLRARGRVALAQLSELSAAFIATIAVSIVFASGLGLAAAQGAAAIVSLIQVTLVAALVFLMEDRTPTTNATTMPALAAVIGFSIPYIPGAMSDWTLFVADRYILASYRDASAVGIYAGCYSLSQALQMISYPLEYSIVALLPKLWDTDRRDEAVELLRRSAHLVLALLAPASTITLLIGPLVLAKLGSNSMAQAAPSILPLLCWGIAIFAYTRLIGLVPLVAHRGRSLVVRIAIAAVANVTMNLVLVPRYGVVGSALATLLSYAAYFALVLPLVREIRRDLVLPGRILRIAAASLLPAGLAFTHVQSARGRIELALLYALVYVVLGTVFGAWDRSDVQLLLKLAKRRR